ncbi:hypothetical protein ACEWY4_022397 [Coilia grayii]|uniref:G-protein coupled receptor family C group 6 member A n=1 Tax=Coilia grayii TaxID=363190 RepID=A0ABD1J5X1_9TELE
MATGCGQLYLCLVITLRWWSLECSNYDTPLMATKDGDIIIGGLFPVHESVNFTDSVDGRPSRRICSRFNVARMLQALMLIEAVETINRSPLLGNLTLGYRIVDSCSDVTTAVIVTHRFLDVNWTVCQHVWNTTDWNEPRFLRPVDVIIGGYHSEISIAVARQLSIREIPQISYGSTTGLLSDKSRFPAFMRTVPEDKYQAQAIVDILVNHGWDWVGLVTTDGDYGRYAAQRFQERAKEKRICMAFSMVLPDILDDSDLKLRVNETITSIEKDDRIQVIVSFAKPDHMMYIMSVLTPNATGRIWLASDNWATSAPRVLQNSTLKDTGTVIGVTLKSATSASFDSYLDSLNPNWTAHENNTILQYYLQRLWHRKPDLGEQLKKNVYPYAIFSVGMAVKAIASAVEDLCTRRDCRGEHFEPWMLKKALRNASFKWEPNGRQYRFDERGDLNTGYDLILWKQNGEHVDIHNIIANYSIQSSELSFINGGEAQITTLVGNINSSCSRRCLPGERKFLQKDKDVCCFECEDCTKDMFSNDTNMVECLACADNYWSNPGSHECQKKVEEVFDWNEAFAIVLMSFAVLGIVLTLVVLVLFLARWATPMVRASVGPVSLLLLVSLLGTFTSTVLFVGRPNDRQCQARQVLFGISFTLCVSCILVKSLKILLAFQIDPSVKLILNKLFQPYLIIAFCVAVQVAICTVWLIKSPPTSISKDKENGKVLLLCQEGEEKDFLYFGLMLAYIGLLSLIGFVIAFKGRKLPDCYNEAKFITFSLLIYFICWVVFGPIYAHTEAGKFQPAVEMIVILFSAYGILGTLFLPKCYIILFKKDSNTREAFLQCMRDHHCQMSQDTPISLTSSPDFEVRPFNSMHNSSSQASLVPRESSDGCLSPVTSSPTAQLTRDAPPPAPVTTEAPRDLMPINRKKRKLARCNTFH